MTISKGAEKQIDAFGSTCAASAMISSTQILVVYNDPATTLSARVLDITTGTKTIDTVNAQQTIVNFGTLTQRLTLVRLSSTKFMCVKAGGGGAATVALVLNVSGTTVTGASTKTLTDAANVSSLITRMLTSTTVLILYTVASVTYARVLSIDGSDNVSEGTRLNAESSGNDFDAELFTSTKAILAFQDSGDSGYLKAQLLTISGTTVSKDGSVQTLNGSDGGDSTATAVAAVSSTQVVAAYSDISGGVCACHVVSLSGSTLSAGTKLALGSAEHYWPDRAISTNATTVLLGGSSALANSEKITQIIKSGTNLSHTISDFVTMTNSASLNKNDLTYITDDFAFTIWLATTRGVILGSDSAVVVTPSHIWLSTDGAATFTDIGDATWAANVVGGVVVVPGTAYQTIFAAVGTNLYKTINGGTAWTLETAIGYEVDFIDLEKDNTTVFLAKRDAAGTNRASLWDGSVLTHINTGKSTTGGATSGGDVV